MPVVRVPNIVSTIEELKQKGSVDFLRRHERTALVLQPTWAVRSGIVVGAEGQRCQPPDQRDIVTLSFRCR